LALSEVLSGMKSEGQAKMPYILGNEETTVSVGIID
jgi:hypothetical protein